MCLTTLYDSPTCGHTWTSLTSPCTPYSDLLSCPSRTPAHYLIAPPHTCPTCNGGFADGETLQMVQGPWGCNQVVRNHYGGEYAVGGGWMGAGVVAGSGLGMGMGGMYGDSRVSGPYGGGYGYGYGNGGPAITYGSQVPVLNRQSTCGDGYVDGGFDECCYECCGGRSGCYDGGYTHGSGKRYRKHDYKYKYRRSTSDGACCVM